MALYHFLCCWLRQETTDEMFENCLFLPDRREICEVMSGYHHTPATMAKLQRPSDQCTLLLVASVAGDATLVELLLEEGDSSLLLTADDRDGNSPLLCASLGGHETVVEALLAHAEGTDLVTRPNHQGTTPIIAAAWRGRLELVKKLAPLEGVSLANKDELNRTARDLAQEWGHKHVVEWIETNTMEEEEEKKKAEVEPVPVPMTV